MLIWKCLHFHHNQRNLCTVAILFNAELGNADKRLRLLMKLQPDSS